MEVILNELSIVNMADSVEEARERMLNLLTLHRELNAYNFNRLRLPDENFFEECLFEGYTVNNWLTDPLVSRTLKTLFMGIKAYPYFDELDESAENQYFSSNYYLLELDHPSNGSIVEGLADAYLRDTLAVSFPTHPVWEKCVISIKDENENYSVLHASTSNCLGGDFEAWCKRKSRPPLNSHADVDLWFPASADTQLSDKSKDDLIYWYQQNHKEKINKIESFIKEIEITPFKGSGKVEPLKENLSGWWSRRISQEHRLVYRVESNVIYICSCKGHYDNLIC